METFFQHPHHRQQLLSVVLLSRKSNLYEVRIIIALATLESLSLIYVRSKYV